MEERGIPPCLLQGEHDYVHGVCKDCGEHLLARTALSSLKIRKCENCNRIISSIAPACPHCLEPAKATLIKQVNNFYLLVLHPIQVFLFAPRICGLSFFEQTFLVIVTALGISFSGYVREHASTDLRIPELKEFFGALIVSFCILPAIFKEPNFFSKEIPFLYRVSLAFQKGVFSDLAIQVIK